MNMLHNILREAGAMFSAIAYILVVSAASFAAMSDEIVPPPKSVWAMQGNNIYFCITVDNREHCSKLPKDLFVKVLENPIYCRHGQCNKNKAQKRFKL